MIEEKKLKLPFLYVDKILKDRNPKLYKIIPRFLLKYLKRIIHQDELNELIAENGHLEGIAFIDAGLRMKNVTTKIIGEENIPKDGRYMFVSNHPLGGLDGVVFISFLGNRYGNVKAVINDLLMNVKNMQSVFAGVNLFGANSKESVAKMEAVFESDAQIMIFPAGLVSRKIDGKIQDLPWRKTFINRAKRHKINIVPVFIEGQNSKFFYNLSNFRKRLGIKFNIELILLPHQMFLQFNKTIPMHFGKPIPYEFFDKKHRPIEWAAKVRQFVYQLPQDNKTSFMDWVG